MFERRCPHHLSGGGAVPTQRPPLPSTHQKNTEIRRARGLAWALGLWLASHPSCILACTCVPKPTKITKRTITCLGLRVQGANKQKKSVRHFLPGEGAHVAFPGGATAATPRGGGMAPTPSPHPLPTHATGPLTSENVSGIDPSGHLAF